MPARSRNSMATASPRSLSVGEAPWAIKTRRDIRATLSPDLPSAALRGTEAPTADSLPCKRGACVQTAAPLCSRRPSRARGSSRAGQAGQPSPWIWWVLWSACRFGTEHWNIFASFCAGALVWQTVRPPGLSEPPVVAPTCRSSWLKPESGMQPPRCPSCDLGRAARTSSHSQTGRRHTTSLKRSVSDAHDHAIAPVALGTV